MFKLLFKILGLSAFSAVLAVSAATAKPQTCEISAVRMPAVGYLLEEDTDENGFLKPVPLPGLIEDMQFLHDSKYKTVLPEQLFAHAAEATELPAAPVLITFRTKPSVFYQKVYPILAKYDQKAVLFVEPDAFDDKEAPIYQEMQQSGLVSFGIAEPEPTDTLISAKMRLEMQQQGLSTKAVHRRVSELLDPAPAPNEQILQITDGGTLNFVVPHADHRLHLQQTMRTEDYPLSHIIARYEMLR